MVNELISLINHENILDRELVDEVPQLSIKYPVILENQWNYRDGTPWIMDKRVIEDDGRTFTIQTLYDMDQDLSWDEELKVYHTYSNNGLVSYTVEMDSIIIMNQVGDIIGSYRNIQNFNLISFQID